MSRSVHTEHAARGFHLARLVDGLRRFLQTVVEHFAERRAEAHLMSLDDRLLKDIGIGRSEIAAVVHDRPLPRRHVVAASDPVGRRISYREAGFGSPVMLLHSTASNGGQWKSLTNALKGHYRVVSPDLPGYGGSVEIGGQEGLRGDAAPVIDLIEEVGAPVDLVGHSYGGAVALKIAADRPELVRSLCLIEPVAFHLLRNAGGQDRALYEQVLSLEAAVRGGAAIGVPGSGMARFIDFWNGEGAWTRLEPDFRAQLCRQADRVLANFASIAREPASFAPLRAIECPTLIVRGERSPAPARRIAELLACAIPGGVLAEIPGAGHMAPLTHPEWVDPLVASHIGGADAAVLRAAVAQGRGLQPAA